MNIESKEKKYTYRIIFIFLFGIHQAPDIHSSAVQLRFLTPFFTLLTSCAFEERGGGTKNRIKTINKGELVFDGVF